MTAIEFLRKIKSTMVDIDNLKFEIENIFTTATKTTPSYSEPIQSSAISDKVANGAEMLAMKHEELDRLNAELDEMLKVIGRMSDPLEKEIIHRYFVRGEKIGEIARNMNYCEKTINRYKEIAIENIEKMSVNVLECPVAKC